MQQALPYKTWQPISTSTSIFSGVIKRTTSVRDMVSENPIIVFGKRGCCMSHVVKRLLLGLGVNPMVYDLDEEDEVRVVDELETEMAGKRAETDGKLQFPAVFIGGKLFGGLDRVMATHITGELVPVLKRAGALWL